MFYLAAQARCQRATEGTEGEEANSLEPGKWLVSRPSSSFPWDSGQATFLLISRGLQIRADSLFLFIKQAEVPTVGKVFLARQPSTLCPPQQHSSGPVQIQHNSVQRKHLVNSSVSSSP